MIWIVASIMVLLYSFIIYMVAFKFTGDLACKRDSTAGERLSASFFHTGLMLYLAGLFVGNWKLCMFSGPDNGVLTMMALCGGPGLILILRMLSQVFSGKESQSVRFVQWLSEPMA